MESRVDNLAAITKQDVEKMSGEEILFWTSVITEEDKVNRAKKFVLDYLSNRDFENDPKILKPEFGRV